MTDTWTDKTEQPRSNEDLKEAQTMIKQKIVSGCITPDLIYYPTIIEAIDELINFRRETIPRIKTTAIYKHILQNLLAIIHGDGGHYTVKHGLPKSVEDAKNIVAKLRDKSEIHCPGCNYNFGYYEPPYMLDCPECRSKGGSTIIKSQ